MPRKYQHDLKSKVCRKPDPENLAKAIEEVKAKTLSLRKAATKYNINYSVINRHLKNKNIKSQGGQPVLNPNEEAFIIDRLKICGDWGYPIDSFMLRMLIKDYLNMNGKCVKRFKNNTPGKDFAYSFLKRHKNELSYKFCQNIKRSRAAVSRETITEYFERLAIELEGVPPENIVNYDETNLRDDPGKKKVIVRKRCKYPTRVMNSSKSSTSVMFSCAGDGMLLPVYVVYKAVNIYDSWAAGGPKDARYNRTKSGWFDNLCFEDWVRTVAVPYFKNKTGKKILIGDNLSSHLSVESIRLCLEHDIHFVFLPANSTHLTQVLDVTFFAPLKNHWRKVLEEWKMGSGRKMTSVPKDKFPRLLRQLLKRLEPNASNNVKAGFKKCGIIPINKEEVLNMLPNENIQIETRPEDLAALERQQLDIAFVNLLKSMRFEDAALAKPKKKSKISVPPGKSIGLKDFEGSEFSDSDGDTAMDEELQFDRADDDCEMEDECDVEENMEPSLLPINSENIKTHDWLAVKIIYSSENPSTSKKNHRASPVKVTHKNGDQYKGTVLKSSTSRVHPGLIYQSPKVENSVSFKHAQVLGKLRKPEKYRGGLLKFDVNVELL